MSYLRLTFFFFLAVIIHWFWSTYFTIQGFSPQVLLVATVIAAARKGPIAGMAFGFVWGLFLDVFQTHLFGANALVLTLVGYGVGAARRQIDVTGLLSLCVIMLMATWGSFVLTGILGVVFMKFFLWVGWPMFLVNPFYNCLLVPFGLWSWDRVVGR